MKKKNYKPLTLRVALRGVTHGTLCLCVVLFIAPFLWMVLTSFKEDAQIFSQNISLIPDPLVWSNYRKAVQAFPFVLYLRNTLLITALCIVGTVLSSSLVGYSFARLRWPGRDVFFCILVATIMIPPQVTMIPTFILFKHLHWIDTYKPLIVPAFFGNAFSIFLCRQFFRGLPKALEEAAVIDGASFFRIWWQIMLPSCKPVLVTIVIFSFIASWNDFFGPLVYLNSESKKTLALGLSVFMWEHGADWASLMALSTLMMIPIIVIFLWAQKYFIKGIVTTGIK